MKKYAGWKVALTLAFACLVVLSAGRPTKAAEEIVLVLDPGHDAHDAGARRTWDGIAYEEETITLKMATYCKEELDKYTGIRVYLTRTTNDVDMDRYARVKIAKDLDADALVSLHINSTANEQDTVSGALAYVPTYSNKAAYAQEARALAADILDSLTTVGLRNIGYLKNENLGIISYGKKWKIPTMIIEHGFVNNPEDCKKFYKSNAKIRKVAAADAAAIAKHYGLVKKQGWQQEGDQMVYFDSDGNKVTGWLTDGGKRYYLDENGHKTIGLCKIKGVRYYFDTDGAARMGTFQVGQNLYRVMSGGRVRTGWFKDVNGNRYYAAKSGKLYRGFHKYKGDTYYFSLTTGIALKGWQVINRKYYYFDEKGRMQTGWTKIKKKYYYFKRNGVRKTGWLKYRGCYCYLDLRTGEKLTKRWLQIGNKFYYLKKSGARVEDAKRVIRGKTYRFNKNGVCLNKKIAASV